MQRDSERPGLGMRASLVIAFLAAPESRRHTSVVPCAVRRTLSLRRERERERERDSRRELERVSSLMRCLSRMANETHRHAYHPIRHHVRHPLVLLVRGSCTRPSHFDLMSYVSSGRYLECRGSASSPRVLLHLEVGPLLGGFLSRFSLFIKRKIMNNNNNNKRRQQAATTLTRSGHQNNE